MKNLIIGANWKSNKTKSEARAWIDKFYEFSPREGLEIIVFPPFTLLDYVSSVIRVNDLPLKVGAQDFLVNKKPTTGGISLDQISEFVNYVLVGHSETRSLSPDQSVKDKLVELASPNKDIQSVLCISNLDELKVVSGKDQIVAYEPLESIGTGNPASPEDVQKIVDQIKNSGHSVGKVLYGGSVNAENVVDYLSTDIDGFLIGTASLDADEFISILKNV